MFSAVHTTGQTVYAFPASKDLATEFDTYKVEMSERGSTGLYETWDLHRGHGLSWLVFDDSAKASAADAITTITLAPTNGYCDVTRDTPYGIQVPKNGGTPTNLAEPLNWALLNASVVNPNDRYEHGQSSGSKPGGQPGCFEIWIPPNGRKSGTVGQNAQMWEVHTPIHVPAIVGGGTVKGGGIAYLRAQNNSGNGTKLYWNPDAGYEDLPMLLIRGAHFHFENIAFLGSPTSTTTTKATLGCAIVRLASGHELAGVDLGANGGTTSTGSIPTTGNTFTNCAWDSFETAIDCGPDGDLNCDFMAVINARVDNCTTFWRNSGTFGLGHYFERVNGTANTMFDFQGGGKSQIRSCILATPDQILLNIGSDGSKIGKNNLEFSLYDCSFDSQANGNAYLVHMEERSSGNAYGSILISGGSSAYDEGTYEFPTKFLKLSSGVTCTIQGYKRIGPIEVDSGASGSVTFRPHVSAIGCSYVKNSDRTSAEQQIIQATSSNDYQLGLWDITQDASSGSLSPRPVQTGSAGTNITITPGNNNGSAVRTLPKEGQSRRLSYDLSAAYASVGKLYSDVTNVRCLFKTSYSTNDRFDKDYADDGKVTLPTSDGIVYVTLEAADFGDGETTLIAGPTYYVVFELTISGVTGTVELDQVLKLRFTEDQE